VIALAACSGQSGSSGSTAPSESQGTAAPTFDAAAPPLAFAVDATNKTVSFRLVATHDNSNSGFNFNGYQKGRLAISVPEGWRVTIACDNKGPLNHSCAIVRGPNDSGPAIDGASSPNPTAGMPAGQSSTFAFMASGQGTYRIACLVPGHEQAGMWDTFTVAAASSGPPTARLSSP
jgi:FtsP/CotA-like multicopper oxidase with cupredoxin domain